jgi:hypothetical protein
VVAGGSELLSGSLGVSGRVARSVSDALTITGLAVPVTLLCFADTGLFLSLVGSLVSAAVGFKHGVGSIK